MPTSNLASRPVYTEAQIRQYMHTIHFPQEQVITKTESNSSKGLSFLQELVKHQLVHIPFENLELHYSPVHNILLDVDHLFHKIVERENGRGGFCMENNTFFGTILRSLGFQTMPVGGRVSSGANMADDSRVDEAAYSPFSHSVNIVTIDGTKYLVDVGFGNRGPTGPIALQHGITGRSTGDESGGNLFRLQQEHIADNTHTNPEQLLWVYSMKFNDRMKYLPIYCFAEVEFLPQDLTMVNYYVSHAPTSFFTYQIICSRFLMEGGKIVGDVTLFEKSVKQRRFGKNETLKSFNTEKERVDALRQHLNVKLDDREIKGIQQMVSAIN